jgi:adenylosuccinate synthase
MMVWLQIGREYGTTTGRPRRIGWMDIPALRYVCRINGLTHINITKLDVLDKLSEIKVGSELSGMIG